MDLLKNANENYNSEVCLLGEVFNGPGYHSNISNGTWVHSTRSSIYYALHLLKEGSPENNERAVDIIEKIISLQDLNSYNETYGIWSWLYEESVDKMSPPDWNWADFIGAALAHIAIDFKNKISSDLHEKV